MATYGVKKIERPRVRSATSGEWADGDRLIVTFERGDGATLRLELPFADYAGLETEWEAGTATTVLDAACDSALAAAGGVDDGTDELTSAQSTFVTSYNYTES